MPMGSRLVEAADFVATVRLWRMVYPAVAPREMAKWREGWEQAVGTLPYLMLPRDKTPLLGDVIEIQCVYELKGFGVEVVQADLQSLWIRQAERGDQAVHSFAPAGDGFALRFAAKVSDSIVEGIVRARKR